MGRVLLDAIALVIGAAVGGLPGAWMLIAHGVLASTGTGNFGSWYIQWALAVVGALLGGTTALAVERRVTLHAWPSAKAVGLLIVGAAVGSAAGLGAILVFQNSMMETAILIAVPLTIISTALAALRFGSRGEDRMGPRF